MTEAVIESGFAKVTAGQWLAGRAQPTASCGVVHVRGLKGLIVPDRAAVRVVEARDSLLCSAADAPFLTRLAALPDQPLSLVSSKLLVAPLESRVGARRVKLIPFSLRSAVVVTEFKLGWVVVATRSRTVRVALAEGEVLTVRKESVVAWSGTDPVGFCPKLGVLDLLLPRGPGNLAFTFRGPAVVWIEGSAEEPRMKFRQRFV